MTNTGFLALADLANHIRAGPRAIWVNDDKEWLESFVKLGQRPVAMTGGPMQAASIYVVPRILHSESRTAAVRLMSWDRGGDLSMSKRWPVKWPTVTVEYFRLSEGDLPALDSATRRLQTAVSRFPIEAPGLNLKGLGDPPERPPASYSSDAPYNRWLYLGLDNGAVEIDFSSRGAPEANAAWTDLWGDINAKRYDPIPADSVRETYAIDPKAYARLLFGEA